MKQISAKIVADSVSPKGIRLITMECQFPRFILAQVNTHRGFCLDGESNLEFDLPGPAPRGSRRVYKMKIADFVDKWINGAKRARTNPKRQYDTSWVDPSVYYEIPTIVRKLGMETTSNLHGMIRSAKIRSSINQKTGKIEILGSDILSWRASKPDHANFEIKDRLKSMKIRQLNERTGKIQTSTVKNVQVSGVKRVFRVDIHGGRFNISASEDHLIYTDSGYKRLGDLKVGDLIATCRRGKAKDDMLDPDRFRMIDGRWRQQWQRTMRKKFISDSPACRSCGDKDGTCIHHIVPVHEAPDLAFEESNITFLCDDCHKKAHSTQGWQGGTYLYAEYLPVISIKYIGERMTYDLEIDGEFPNFIANGVVVHNSRNSASSRAIPIHKRLQEVEEDPYIPIYLGANQPGMQSGPQVSVQQKWAAENAWRAAAANAVYSARIMASAGIHKEVVNRLLEPFLWHKAIISATEWENFFSQRLNHDAQPEIRQLARVMRDAIDASVPLHLAEGDFHLPYIQPEELTAAPKFTCMAMSVARCARVSYLNHDGTYSVQKDMDLFKKLKNAMPPHLSPFEHVARPLTSKDVQKGNFQGWVQFRHIVEEVADIL